MGRSYFLDTDVLVEYLRGTQKAIAFLESLKGDLFVSAITVAELFSGVRGEREEDALERFLLAFRIIPVDEELAKQGGLLRRDYHPSHGVGLADAIIAATASRLGAGLVTFNRRHYPMVEDITVPWSRV